MLSRARKPATGLARLWASAGGPSGPIKVRSAERIVLAVVVAEEGPARDVGRFGDVVDRGPREALLGEQPVRRRAQRLAGLVLLPVPPSLYRPSPGYQVTLRPSAGMPMTVQARAKG
jgi:hypothetical protein